MSTSVSFCISKDPTPLFNSPDFPDILGQTDLPLDDQGLLRCVEMIALPKTKFTVLGTPREYVLEVSTQEYPGGSYFIDRRFVETVLDEPTERVKQCPSIDEIEDRLLQQLGAPYIWGGNYSKGIDKHKALYASHLSPSIQNQKQRLLQGVDCSGLLYEACGGVVPRNTKELISYGHEIFSLENVKRLDILVWPGHVILFLSPERMIESLQGKGVILSNTKNRLQEISKQPFTIRRIF